jgi:hypothetical protein
VLALLIGACSRAPDSSTTPDSYKPMVAEVKPEAAVIKAMRTMKPSDLSIVLGPKTQPDLKTVTKTMDDIKNRGPNAGDWIEACLSAPPDFPAVVFEARPGEKKLNVEKDLGPYKGPEKGAYKSNSVDNISVNWYTFGRIDIGIEPADDSYYVVRVRHQ